MKFTRVYFSLCMLVCLFWFTVAVDINEELIEEVNQLEQRDLPSLVFETFSSCEDMTSTLEDFITDNFKNTWYRWGWWMESFAVDMVEESAMMDDDESASAKSVWSNDAIVSSTTDYSTTNLQVTWVDEADIIKSNGSHIYYYNATEHKIHIIRGPLDTTTWVITLWDVEILHEISIPETFWWTELYITDNRLTLLAQRWSDASQQWLLNKNARTNVVVYDVSDVTNPKLIKLTDLDGSYNDSRLIGDELYVISDLWINRWYPGQFMDTNANFSLDTDDILPKAISIDYTKNSADQNLTIWTTTFPYHIDITRPDCSAINYVLPTKESLESTSVYPSFTIVRKINIADIKDEIYTTAAFWSTQSIYMSQDSLYLTSPFYTNSRYTCPPNARCIAPFFESGQHTLLHKFSINTLDVEYIASQLVQWSPLNQWSMSEDEDGFFRVLTSSWQPDLATHLFILDEDLDEKGSLLHIEPWEEFKAARYIGDKLYLVTFERTDPLFVIDMEDVTNPTIMGELKIPWYSTYLHPFAPEKDGVQYLIGLWYDTKENQWWWITTNGVKVDLYLIDFVNTDEDWNIIIQQLHTKTRWEEQSYTEAIDNPRMFVWDEKKQSLLLPMVLSNVETAQECTIQYDVNGNEKSRNCWNNDVVMTEFAWLKWIIIDPASGIIEKQSYNYVDKLAPYLKKQWFYEEVMTDWFALYPRQFTQLNFRVWYLGDVFYTLSNAFAHFKITTREEETYLDL